MPVNVSIKVAGDKETIAKLKKLGQSFVTFDAAMRAIGKDLTDYFSGPVFNSQGGLIGERWQRLASSTLRSKAKTYPGRGAMVRTGAMKAGFESNASSNSVTISNSADYFAYHQSNEPRSKLPRRIMMKATPGVRGMVRDIIDADINSKIRRAGLNG